MSPDTSQTQAGAPETVTLKRRLSLSLLVFYGLGITVGAGIYVLVGLAAAEAGRYTPVSFLLAAGVVAFTGLSYAELSTRYPVSAGEAAYVESAFGLRSLTLLIGLAIAAAGLVSSSTIAIGASGYLGELTAFPQTALVILIVLILSGLAAWGILESVTIAAVFTLIEIAGLVFVVIYGIIIQPDIVHEIGSLVPPFEPAAWGGIVGGGVIAFFAFIGFEDLANVAEEAEAPERNMPRAILLTLIVSTVIYLAVAAVVVLSVPMDELKQSTAPLSLMFSDDAAWARGMITLIAGIATLNGVLIQMIMSSRVIYGLADRGYLPRPLARVSPTTRTPLVATGLVAAIILVLVLLIPVEALAELTSQIVLVVFITVNFALVWLKRKGTPLSQAGYKVHISIPCIGAAACALMLLASII